jgi:hypothetical protein
MGWPGWYCPQEALSKGAGECRDPPVSLSRSRSPARLPWRVPDPQAVAVPPPAMHKRTRGCADVHEVALRRLVVRIRAQSFARWLVTAKATEAPRLTSCPHGYIIIGGTGSSEREADRTLAADRFRLDVSGGRYRPTGGTGRHPPSPRLVPLFLWPRARTAGTTDSHRLTQILLRPPLANYAEHVAAGVAVVATPAVRRAFVPLRRPAVVVGR